ncbi:hypothetical protein Dcar01_03560 [Deinococcus carri]|uniref:Uncharacterized protein n=1 Tax=Deinococcus carri TaxID=1211323 RepID=A0ABP9WBU1_9DEIO
MLRLLVLSWLAANALPLLVLLAAYGIGMWRARRRTARLPRVRGVQVVQHVHCIRAAQVVVALRCPDCTLRGCPGDEACPVEWGRR